MSKMNNNGESENSELKKEYEAYKTLQRLGEDCSKNNERTRKKWRNG